MMKKIRDLIKKRGTFDKKNIDEKSIFYIFQSIVGREYGSKGTKSIAPVMYKNRKLFIKAEGSTWANEIWMNKGELIEKVNKKIGTEEIKDIKVKSI